MRVHSFLGLAAATLFPFVSAQAPTVTVDNGVFVGTQTSIPGFPQSVNKFLGVPYAVTPPQRFSAPVKAPASTTTRNATNFGPGCIQQGNPPNIPGIRPLPVTPPPDSEDCLYANVYVPATAGPSGGRTVMVFIYGGAFISGSSSYPVTEGAYFASNQDVIIVSFNYRTNVFGFPGQIPGSGIPLAQTNVGLLDQKLLLDWVQRNIAAFGGDPTKVTIFGESAGAASVDLHTLTYTPTNAPFRATIQESGTYYLVGNGIGLYGPQNTTVTPIQQLSQNVGCGWGSTTLACLRSKTAAQLKSAEDSFSPVWQPIPDGGVTVPANNNGQKVRTLLGGARVPALSGTNANEATLFLLGTPGTFKYVYQAFPELQPYDIQLRAAYPIGGCSVTGCWPSEFYAAAQALSDYLFTCPQARESRTESFTLVPNWRYLYNQTQPFIPPLANSVFHASELPLVFGSFDPSVQTPAFQAVTSYMQGGWANFAKNPLAGPGWKLYTSLPFLKEIAMIGGPQNPNGRYDVDNTVVDAYCWIYQNIYQQRDPLPF